ncbi:SMP-30/gluconolactonase/LRE family protein [Maritimibacter dapengensis]|uniref:SMP-30/gluconolactonase/LRE family protein n=1 Tax=Maritimibacter dapengensis TaxID=2836868 RepID=A0ABS6SZR6_9RHOB|nr:SMP-30/gluconolactonase/LRE family protein [Maritimibacter dapengensis]MBV7378473.1 SMP-30/gluconolactonase/LRE family protein [Maritimibacter dapengensis]
MKYIFCAVACVAAGGAMAASHGGGWTLEGFTAPESAYYDADSGQIVVSNIGTFGPDGGQDGKLSLVSPEGEMVNADWVTGLMDPKGMASMDGKLYVADATGLHVVDIASGALDETITLEGAQFPNDVAVGPDGAIYVTDMFAGGVYKVMDGAAEMFVPAGTLDLPNGIWAAQDRLVVGSMGKEFVMAEGRIEGAGALVAVDYGSGEKQVLEGAEETGAIDGVVEIGGKLIYSDNPTGEIVAYENGALTTLSTTEAGAADIGVMDNMVLVPLMQGGKVMAMPVE